MVNFFVSEEENLSGKYDICFPKVASKRRTELVRLHFFSLTAEWRYSSEGAWCIIRCTSLIPVLGFPLQERHQQLEWIQWRVTSIVVDWVLWPGRRGCGAKSVSAGRRGSLWASDSIPGTNGVDGELVPSQQCKCREQEAVAQTETREA